MSLPNRLFTKKLAPFWSMLIGAVVGSAIAWWLSLPEIPWLEFTELKASYVSQGDNNKILLSGQFLVRKTCRPEGNLIWRVEVLATDGQLAIYGPRASAPETKVGVNQYFEILPLLQPIDPDGWTARLLVSCIFSGKVTTVVSPTAVVNMEAPEPP